MIGRAAVWLLRRVAAPELADEIEGDLREQQESIRRTRGATRAGLWFAGAVLVAACALAWSRTPFASSGSFLTPPLPPRRRGLPMSLTDLKLAIRLVAKQPVLSGTAVAALAVAMCLAVTGFSVMNAVLFAELPLPDGENYVVLQVTDPETLREVDVPLETFEAWQNRSTTLAALGGVHWAQGNLELEDSTPVVLRIAHLTPEGMRMTQTEPLIGRIFEAADGVPDAAPVAILREDLWRQHLGADASAVGKAIRISGREYTLIGVMPEAYTFPESQNLWLPFGAAAGHSDDGVEAYALLHPDTPRAAAEAELRTLLESTTPAGERPLRLRVLPFARGMSGEGFELFMTVALVLLLTILAVAAANVANLVLVRTTARTSELAVRAALGASRSSLVLQVFGEVLVLGATAAAIAVAVSVRIVAWLDALIASEAPMWITLRVEPAVIAFAAFLAVFASAIASVAPALRSTSGSLDVALRHGSAAVVSPRFGRASSVLVLAQVALSVALLSAAAVLARGLVGYQWADLGIDESGILTASLYLPPQPDAEEPVMIGNSLANELSAAPQFSQAGLTMELPKSDAARRKFEIDRGDRDQAVDGRAAYVGVNFLQSLGVAPGAGRLFQPADHAEESSPVVVINESFAAHYFGGADPVGQRLRIAADPEDEPDSWREIVGVVRDLAMSPGVPEEGAGLYIPVQRTNFFHATARFNGPVGEAAAALRRVVAEHDIRILVRDIQTLDKVGWEARTLLRSVGLGLAALGAMAMALSAAGIYAILAFSVQQRTREIGVRVALGARHGQVLRSIMGSTSIRLAIGAAIGVGLAFLLARATVVLPIDLPALSLLDVSVMAGTMIMAGALAAWVPARRAGRVSPAEALRND